MMGFELVPKQELLSCLALAEMLRAAKAASAAPLARRLLL